MEARAIAENMNVDERMDVTYEWEKEKKKVERFEEDQEESASSYSSGYSKKEKKEVRDLLNYHIAEEFLEFPFFGLPTEEEMRIIKKRFQKDMEEIATGDVVHFTMDAIEDMAREISNWEVTGEEKKIEVTVCINVIRQTVRNLEDQANIERNRRKMYSREYHKMKGLYIEYRKKYEALSKRKTKGKEVQVEEKEVQVDIRKEMEMDVEENEERRDEHRDEERENQLEKKINDLIEKVSELEKRIPRRDRNISRERKEEEEPWTKVLGRKRQEKKDEPRQKKEVGGK